MKTLTKDSPELTAYALGELVGEDIENVILNDPELLIEVEQIRQSEVLLSSYFKTDSALSIGELRKAQVIQQSSKVISFPNTLRNTVKKRLGTVSYVALSSAAIITLGVMLLKMTPASEREVVSSYSEVDELLLKVVIAPAVIPEGESSLVDLSDRPAANLPKVVREFSKEQLSQLAGSELERVASARHVDEVLSEQAPVTLKKDSRFPVPVTTGIASYNAVKRSLASSQLPPPDIVRVEELINSYDYNQPVDFSLNGLSAGVSVVDCPWNSSAVLVGLLIKANDDVSALSANIEFNSDAVSQFRLVGYNNLRSEFNQKKLHTFDGSNFVFYEVISDSKLKEDELLRFSISWLSGGKMFEHELPVNREVVSWASSSEDLRAAVTLACFAKYLKYGEQFPMSLQQVSDLAAGIQPSDNRFAEGFLLVSAAEAVEEYSELILAAPQKRMLPKR